MKFTSFVAAAVLSISAAPSFSAVSSVTLVNGTNFESKQNIAKSWADNWTFNSAAFKVTDGSPILFSFDFAQNKNDKDGFFANLSVKLVQGVNVLASHTFSQDQGAFMFTNQFAANKNYKFVFEGYTPNYEGKFNYTVAAVPEPETYALMGMGLIGLIAARRRKLAAA